MIDLSLKFSLCIPHSEHRTQLTTGLQNKDETGSLPFLRRISVRTQSTRPKNSVASCWRSLSKLAKELFISRESFKAVVMGRPFRNCILLKSCCRAHATNPPFSPNSANFRAEDRSCPDQKRPIRNSSLVHFMPCSSCATALM